MMVLDELDYSLKINWVRRQGTIMPILNALASVAVKNLADAVVLRPTIASRGRS
jgi:hypothetical protein